MKKVVYIIVFILCFVFLTGCDPEEIIDVKLVTYPENLIYEQGYSGIVSSKGMTVKFITNLGNEDIEKVEYFTKEDLKDVDFSKVGVQIIRREYLYGKVEVTCPIQVVPAED